MNNSNPFSRWGTPKFHASLNNYMTDNYRSVSSLNDVEKWMNILLNPPKNTIRNKVIMKTAGKKLHEIYSDWNPQNSPWYSGFLLDWIVFSETAGAKTFLTYENGILSQEEVPYDNIPYKITEGIVPLKMIVYGKVVDSTHFIAESMSSNDDILQFTMTELLNRIRDFGFEIPATIQSFEDSESVLNFLSNCPKQPYLVAVDYMYYRECIGYSSKYPMWGIRVNL